jgi:hypothetical protein
MSAVALIVAAIICIFLIYMYYEKRKFTPFNINGDQYFVQSQFNDSKEAAQKLAKINSRVMIFLRHLKTKYGVNRYDGQTAGLDPVLTGIAERILSNYNPEVIKETDPIVSSDTSYTVDKGKQLYVCMRSKKPPYALHDDDDLFFVVLHELSHMGTTTFGHNDEFWQTFKFVLHEASLSGAYKPVDYGKKAVAYCGLNVNYNPYFDSKIKSLWV